MPTHAVTASPFEYALPQDAQNPCSDAITSLSELFLMKERHSMYFAAVSCTTDLPAGFAGALGVEARG